MSVGELAPPPIFTALAPSGGFLVDGQLFSYAGGTSTPQNTYTDSTLLVPNDNPVVLNAYGQAQIWFDPALTYKLVLRDAAGNLLWTADNISPYINAASLASTLASYATISSLSAYVLTSSLSGTLAAYALTSSLSAYALLNSPNFVGVPTGPTAAPGTSTTQFATTAFVDAATSVSNMRSGTFTCVAGTAAVTFATPFPSACTGVWVQPYYNAPDLGWVSPGSVSASGFSYTNGNSGTCFYYAVGS
jgi:hypothetical protein